MNLIAAVDLHWGIGYNGDLLEKIPEDMKYFKEKTLGKVVVMGRKTFESLPNKEPLKGRINIILTHNKEFAIHNKELNTEVVLICFSIEELLEKLKNYNDDDIFVIGGEAIYTQLLPYCNKAYITKIYKNYLHDKEIIDLSMCDKWSKIISGEKHRHNNEIYYSFDVYVKEIN